MTKADRLGIAVILRGAYVQCGFEQPGVYPDGKDIAKKRKRLMNFRYTIRWLKDNRITESLNKENWFTRPTKLWTRI
jgi:hypothetical protein